MWLASFHSIQGNKVAVKENSGINGRAYGSFCCLSRVINAHVGLERRYWAGPHWGSDAGDISGGGRIMPHFFCSLIILMLLAGCKIVTTDTPFVMGAQEALAEFPSGAYTADSGYGNDIFVAFTPSGGMIRTGDGPQASIAYSYGASRTAADNRGELLVSPIPSQSGVFVLSTSGALTEVKKDGVWQADTAASNYTLIARRHGDQLDIYGVPKEAFKAPLEAALPATAASNAGVAKATDMQAFLADLDYGEVLKSEPLFRLVPMQSASVTALLDRNIPNAVKLYEDASGVYYGAYMTFRDHIPFPSNKDDQYLYVYSVRKPLSDGRIVDIERLQVQDQYGKTVPGYRYGTAEIARAVQHIIPALQRAFPNEKRIQRDVMFRLFLDGYHGRWEGQPYGASDAERAHLRLRFIKRDSQYRPEYENIGKAGLPLEGFFNSAAQIRAAFPQMEPEIVDARRDNRALYIRYAAERDQLKANQLANILATMNEKRRPGIVYKTASFWKQYPNFDDIQDVFDGNFDLIDHSGNFGSAYSSFVRMYDAQCRQHLVNRVKRVVKTWKEDEWGTPYDGDISHYYIDGRFYPYYDKMLDLAGRKTVSDMVGEALDGFKNGDVLAAIGNSFAAGMQSVIDYATMRRFIADHGCLSAPVQQLLENLVAAPLGEPPVQQTSKTFPGAAQASTAYVLADAKRFFEEGRERAIREYKAGRTPVLGDRVIRPYLAGQLANDGFRVNKILNKVSREIQETAHPVLTCFYGPTRQTDSGTFMYETVKYWYKEKPAQWPAFVAAATNSDDIYPGLQHAVQQCPATLDQAQALTGPISGQW